MDESSYRRERKITGETRALVSFAGFLAERLLTGGASMEGADRDFKRAGEALSGELTKARADEVLARTKALPIRPTSRAADLVRLAFRDLI